MLEHFINRCCFFDVEAGRDGRIHKIGAICGDDKFLWDRNARGSYGINEFDSFCSNADFIAGHNIIQHDLPLLAKASPDRKFLRKPVVDTLFLSPLAFPENPYHRLVKDYKLVLDSINDPSRDAELSRILFVDQWNVFSSLMEKNHDVVQFYAGCFSHQIKHELLNGFTSMFNVLGVETTSAPNELKTLFKKIAQGKYCISSLDDIFSRQLHSDSGLIPLAYCAAWLRVAGHNSVLPSWVRRTFIEVPMILDQLRENPCADSACAYCSENHHPQTLLKRFFGFDDFRRNEKGDSLQEAITLSGLRGESMLGILPTGGGKSLCFQLPALSRNYRRGVLTIVISPLQALMKDQVDNLARLTGTPFAGALYGLLTPPERGELLERVRRGDIAILYVSPEQLRNPSFHHVISQREIGCWVFDEAHCLSKWGHDFRTDYLYAGRFIREFCEKMNVPVPPVACFTATAKKDVVDEVRAYFKNELGKTLEVFNGSVKRENLRFEVRVVNTMEKFGVINDLLAERLGENERGSAVVFRGTRKKTESTAEFLKTKGWTVEKFHAGLKAPEKRRIQEAFINGEIQVICATNAFGMGVDKENVRLVVHGDIPGSLENYIQEAGRAGRDRLEAECILLYDEKDVENQFQLDAHSQLSRYDIGEILRGLRRASKRGKEIVITAGELLRDEETLANISIEDSDSSTKVRTAISWLERAGFVERNHNQTFVFQCKPQVSNLEEAEKLSNKFNITESVRRIWLAILERFFNAGPDELLTVDDLAELPAMKTAVPKFGEERSAYRTSVVSETVVKALRDMAEAGLVKKGLRMTTFVTKNSLEQLERLAALEKEMLDIMRESDPDPDPEDWRPLMIKQLNQKLLDAGHKCVPDTLRNLLKSLGMDGQGFANSKGSVDLRFKSQDCYLVKLNRSWEGLTALAIKRHVLGKVILNVLIAKLPDGTVQDRQELVEFDLDEIETALRHDKSLAASIRNSLAAIERTLMYLHEQKVVILQQGLAVFRQSMRIKLFDRARKGTYSKGDFAPLAEHYQERIFQVHVMDEYAKLGTDKINQALNFVAAYFSMDKKAFVDKFFEGRSDMLEMATTADAYHRIVDDLNNPTQESIVTAEVDANLLVMAGPGSGKTRALVHRCAYLITVKKISPRHILMLCFNRDAMIEIRKRLIDLVGEAGRRVTVLTYHALAMRITGRSFAGRNNGDDEPPPFDDVVREAIGLLGSDGKQTGMEPDELRERILGGYNFILVDEYQDIDQLQYDLVSAVAGRSLKGGDHKLSIMAVGDDDQNIFTFRGANVAFIQQFQRDYQADIRYMVENYRSTRHIIDAANSLISHNSDRMKTGNSIRIDQARKNDPRSGEWGGKDPVNRGKIAIFELENAWEQAHAVCDELNRIKALDADTNWNDFAILSRNRSELDFVRSICESRGVPVSIKIGGGGYFSIRSVREIRGFLSLLEEKRGQIVKVAQLHWEYDFPDNMWGDILGRILNECEEEVGEVETPVEMILEFFHESLDDLDRDKRIGHGVFLATAHSCKGLEFPHVFILGEGWGLKYARNEMEEERRLYYVALTRAKKTATLFARADCSNLFVGEIDPETVVKRKNINQNSMEENDLTPCEYVILEQSDLFVSFAGHRMPNRPIHKHLASLTTGSSLKLVKVRDRIELRNSRNFTVARLSKKARERFWNQIGQIDKVKVIAMIEKRKIDIEDPEWAQKCRVDKWELPVVELKLKKMSLEYSETL